MDLVQGIVFLAPGFLAIKVFHIVGAQRPHSQWEWTTWSIIVSLPINGLAMIVRPYLGGQTTPPLDPYEIALSLAIAAIAGLIAGLIWQRVRWSKRDTADSIRRLLSSSAWDLALDDVERDKRQIEVVLHDGKTIIGTLCYGGREDNEAEGWIYVLWPETVPEGAAPGAKHEPTPRTFGILLHRDQINHIRALRTKKEGDARRAAASGAVKSSIAGEG